MNPRSTLCPGITRRSFSEAIKQIRAVARVHGPFDAVHVELARDVGKSAEERRKLENGIEERNAEKDRRKAQAASILGRSIGDDELLRYELAMEQVFKCVYCDAGIDPQGGHVEHIVAARHTAGQQLPVADIPFVEFHAGIVAVRPHVVP